MDGSSLVFIVVPIVIPAFSSARQLDLGFPELDVTRPLPGRLDSCAGCLSRDVQIIY